MLLNKTNFDFTKNYIDKKEQEHESKHVQWIKIIVFLILYVTTMVIQLSNVLETSINGVISQVQVMMSTYIVMSVKKRGFVCAVVFNLILCCMAGGAFFINGNLSAAPGVIIPICTIVTISIIFFFEKRLDNKIKEVINQKEEIYTLYEEVVHNEKEILEKNSQLIQYNKEIKKSEEKLSYLAFFDVLTEIPNRKMIIDRIDFLISLAESKKISFATVFIDLDNFKKINDSMGHHAGDLLLKAVTSKLKGLIHSKDMLGRLGGDEFAIIIQRELKEEEILEYVENLKDSLMDCFVIENTEFNTSASLGISMYPQDGKDSAELLKCADTAMYKAKEYGKNGVYFFRKEMKEDILKKIEFENRLLSAIKNEEIFLVFQPQYTSNSKELRGFEVLVRWKSPELGLVSPGQFIPVAEETGFIVQLGEFIFRKACEKFKYIQDKYNIMSVISVNISALQIMDPYFVQMVKNVLEETKFDVRYLELEITESVFISSVDYVINIINELKEMGISIALDDFGTGYSSLNYLQLLPIDTLKIDKSFIDSIDNNTKKQIVGSIISLVHKMEISVVAEGIENEIQLEYLKKHECDFIQGFLWGKPLNEEEVSKLLNLY